MALVARGRDNLELNKLSEVITDLLPRESRIDREAPLIPLNRSLTTRTACLVGLVATYAIGIPVLVYGAYRLHAALVATAGDGNPNAVANSNPLDTSKFVSGSPLLKELVPLSVNIGVTALTESLGLIHATTLRWSLLREGRLDFNSNLRLFTNSRRCWANSWISNNFNAIFLIVSYASTSLVFVPGPTAAMSLATQGEPYNSINPATGKYDNSHFDNGLAISGIALITLGSSLLGQALFATPIDTAIACHQQGAARMDRNTMLSVGDAPTSTPSLPHHRQKSAFAAHKDIRRVYWLLWALFVFGVLWTISLATGIYMRSKQDTCQLCGAYSGTGWWPIPDLGGLSPFATVQRNTQIDPIDPSCLMLVFVFQATLTLGLHCAELLVNVSRDEDTWRTTYTQAGYNGSYESILAAAKSWKTIVLTLAKPFIHWLYGLGVTFILGNSLIMRPAQLMYMTLAFLALAGFGTYIAKTRPKGPQPVSYGQVQTIINLVDEWHSDLHWGHKSEDAVTGICHAGTSDKALPAIKLDREYL